MAGLNLKQDTSVFEVNKDNPLHDLHFGRKIFAEQLEKIISNLDDPFVISLDSQWGSGKTYFLKRFEAYLKYEKKYCVLYYNAWENDDEKDPFTSLIVEFTSQMKEYVEENNDELKNISEKAGKFLLKSVPLIFEKIAKNYLGDEAVDTAKEFFSLTVDDSEKLIEKLSEDKKMKKEFKESLETFREYIVAKKMQDKIIILVDELDRCRPDYAVELLERIKHLFNVENYIFVLGIDREQIVNSIKQIYGKDMDDRNYLKRFFDFE
ncbi:MAG: KAP family P-loop NTPase fold protein, partial [Fusobacteriaceae bacterium]